MEKITFAFSSESIRNSFYERNDEKNILQFPFLFQNQKKADFVINNIDGRNIINIKLELEISIIEVSKIIERPLPEIFNCEKILIQCIDGLYKIEEIKKFIKSKDNKFFKEIKKVNNKTYKELNFEFIGYGSDRFNAIFNKDSIIKYFNQYTSINFLNKKKIYFKYFNKKFVIESNVNENDKKKLKNFTHNKFQNDNYSFQIKIWNNQNKEENLNSINVIFNEIKINDKANEFLKQIEKNIIQLFDSNVPQFERFISFEVTLHLNDIDIDEKFKIVNNDKFKKIINDLDKKISQNSFTDFKKITLFAEELSLKSQVEKLNLRKEKLRNSRMVYVNNELIFREPGNEQETVLLFIKLAMIKEVPIKLINILEYSTSEGIDAIADVQLDQSSPVEKYCLIEFEPTFGQFLSHKHPPKHVDYIICWSVEKHHQKNLKKNNNWLYSFNLENYPKEVKVIEISKFNNLKVR